MAMRDASAPEQHRLTEDRADPVSAVPTRQPSPEASSALGHHVPGLDGVRGIAVLLVLLYHGGISWTRGGFLGVSLFFTLSGFLITGVLLRNHVTGRRGLGSFWGRRFRRLMPAAFLALAGIVIFGITVADRQQAVALPGDIAAAATWTANWHFILNGTSYLDIFSAPSPVQHFWSLAIEEQLYVLLPITLVLLARRRYSPRVTAIAIGAAALASTVWMALLSYGGATFDRVYYGTDTRMAELLAGAVLAVVVARTGLRWSAPVRRTLGAVGLVAFTALLLRCATATLGDVTLYRGGLLVFALLSCATIVGVLAGGPLAVILSTQPLPAIGRISYGLYLYHWPIYLWLTEARTGLDGWELLTLRLLVTFTVATASFHLVERPILRGEPARLPRWGRFAFAPVAALVVTFSAVVFVDQSAPDPLAALRGGGASASLAHQRDDGVLDVLVIPERADDATIQRLEARAADEPSFKVRIAPDFTCTGDLVDVPGGRTCAGWARTWPKLVRDFDPDVVLLVAGTLPGDRVESTGPLAGVLGAGFDLLTRRGATVVWVRPPGADFADFYSPFSQAMFRLGAARTDLDTAVGVPGSWSTPSDQDAAVTAMLASASLNRRRPVEDLPRILVVGDSQAIALGYGLDAWASEHRRAIVWVKGVEGCGLVQRGDPVTTAGALSQTDRCRAAIREWPRLIETLRPDLVVVLSSLADTQDRRVPGEQGPASIGDAALDDLVVREYTQAIDALSASGAHVIWMRPPCLDDQTTAVRVSPYVTSHIEYLARTILPRVARARPNRVRFYPLDEVLCPGGTPRRRAPGGIELRPDGVHLSAAGARWFAEHHADELLRLWPRGTG